MPLLRVFSKMDDKNKITIPRGMRKELNIKPGDRLELTLVPNGVLLRSITSGCRRDTRKVATFGSGINKARKLIISKTAGRCIK